mgnify:FL=1
MDREKMTTSILDMCMGAIKERVDYDAARVVENILDPNTDAKAKRKITLTIDFLPSADRTHITVHTGSKAALAPTAPVETSLGMMSDANGEMQLVELLPQVAGQMDMDGSAAPEPKVLKLAALADQRKTM